MAIAIRGHAVSTLPRVSVLVGRLSQNRGQYMFQVSPSHARPELLPDFFVPRYMARDKAGLWYRRIGSSHRRSADEQRRRATVRGV